MATLFAVNQQDQKGRERIVKVFIYEFTTLLFVYWVHLRCRSSAESPRVKGLVDSDICASLWE